MTTNTNNVENDMDDPATVTLCADCGCELDPGYDYDNNTDGDPVCVACADDYCDCADCGERIRIDDAAHNADGDPICEDCGDNYYFCEDCERTVHSDDINDIDGRIVCDYCLSRNYAQCEHCGEHVHYDDAIELRNGNHVCPSCRCEGPYYICEECGEVDHGDNGGWGGDSGEAFFCGDCYQEYAVIKDYSYKPSWDYHSTTADHRSDPSGSKIFYLGVELEVENKLLMRSNNDIAREVIDTVPAICKHDSSINNGFEIVFHPQTFTYANTDGREAIGDMLSTLRRYGFAGHNYGGMHVHISRPAFSRLHLYKFHRLFTRCANLLTFISQRNPENLSKWASFHGMGDIPGSNGDRYVALNYTYHTVEVRIFNSTIRTDRFFKNLETVKAALDFSKQYGIRDMDPDAFLRFVMERRYLYKNLVAFLVERVPASLVAADVDQKAIRQVQKKLSRRTA